MAQLNKGHEIAGNKRRIICIVQARMGSARLPNKMMLWLHGFPVIFWIFHRLSKSKILSKIVFALPATDANIGLAYYIKSFGGNVFEGSEYNVLERFYDAAQANSADIVVRVCGDNPFVCGREIDRLINFYETSNLDYAYNHAPIGNSYPDGIGAEVTSFNILKYMHENAVESNHREHVFNFLLDSSYNFKIGTFNPEDAKLHATEIRFRHD